MSADDPGKNQINIRNKNHVEALSDSDGRLVGYAWRITPESSWGIYTLNEQIVATVKKQIPEVLQRKIVCAILEVL